MSSAASERKSSVPRPLSPPDCLFVVTVVCVSCGWPTRSWTGCENGDPGAGCGVVAAVVAVGPAAYAGAASANTSKNVRTVRTTNRVAHRCETLGPDGPEVARTDPRRARRAALSRAPDLGLAGPRCRLVRRDDQRPRRAARRARGQRPAVQPERGARGALERRHGEGAVPNGRW